MHKVRCWLLCTSLLTSYVVYAQDADSVLRTVPAFTSQDSLSILRLIDSLLQIDIRPSSQVAVRLSYNSNVLSAGRTLGIQNFGLSQGISYYHKTGLYADVSGYWSKDFKPAYYLTVASVGYMHDFSKKFSIMAGYDHYVYNMPDGDNYIPYRNTLSFAPILEFKPITFSINYAYYFGDKRVHRVMPALSLTVQKRKWLGVNRIAISPSFYTLLGNEIITEVEIVSPKTVKEARENYKKYGMTSSLVETNKNVFGVMNYAFSLPLIISNKTWSFSFTYTYNIPKALPDEPLTISESSYLSGSFTYFIDLKGNKNPL